jgi:hypothetical protein
MKKVETIDTSIRLSKQFIQKDLGGASGAQGFDDNIGF